MNTSEHNASNHFDSVAATWDQPHRVERARQMFELLLARDLIADDQSVVDYGCGSGVISLLLAGQVKHVYAVDASEGMLDVLRHKLDQKAVANVTPCVAENFTPAPASVSGVETALTLHHVHDVSAVLLHFYTMLEPGGWLCIFDLDKEDGTFHQGMEGHAIPHHGFERDAFTAMLNDIGFTVEFLETVMTIEKEVDGKPVAFPVFQLIAQKAQ